MDKEEAIKYLQQLYPNGGHCWLDEQRMEAIGMAIQALQEEPVSDDLEEAMQHNVPNNIGIDDLLYWRNGFITGSKWQKEQNKQWLADNHKQIFNNGFEEGFEAGRDDMEEQLKKDAIYGEWFRRGIVLPSEYYADDIKKVKLIIVKED